MSLTRLFILRGPEQAAALRAFLKQNAGPMAKAGKPLSVEVREHKAKRSSQANRRYWAMLRFISATAWVNGRQFSDDVWHEHYARKFIGVEDMPDGGQKAISTTTLDVAAFNEYMDSIAMNAQLELGIEMAEFS